MSGKILIFSLLVVLVVNAYSQTYPIPAKGSQWGCTTMLGPPGFPGSGIYGGIEKYEITDTVIYNITYQHWAGEYTRYVNNRLFLLDAKHSTPDSLIETVYYDFNLEVGDSFNIPLAYWEYAFVTKVSLFETLNGQFRKWIQLKIKDEPCGSQLDWIEGVGDINNCVFYNWQIGLCDIYRKVVCFSDSSGDVFLGNGFTYPCDSLNSYVRLFDTTSIDNVNINLAKQRIAYPNPFNNEIRIDLSGLSPFRSASLFNAAGVLVLKSDLPVIQTENLKSGVYILKVEFSTDNYFCRMIKN